MNDKEITDLKDPTDPMGSDPIPPTDPSAGEAQEKPQGNPAPTVAEDQGDPLLSADPCADSDSGNPCDPAPTAEEQLEQLRSELKALQTQMAERESYWQRMGAECEEFLSLYPETPLSEVPDAVWNDVGRGIPLAAAYALAAQKKRRAEELAKISNHQNEQRSAGAAGGGATDYFSPAEVRAMSQSEVRANYQSIMRSMPKWR